MLDHSFSSGQAEVCASLAKSVSFLLESLYLQQCQPITAYLHTGLSDPCPHEVLSFVLLW